MTIKDYIELDLPEGLHLTSDLMIVDAQDHVWVAFYEGAPGDPETWLRSIVELVKGSLKIK